jgi:DNA-binding GntR family transcriptional regulator
MQVRDGIKDSFQKLRQRSLVGEVRDELERMILAGELETGERLNEISLAGQLGVSRGPVREAARSLEREGLVKAVANQGVYVRKLSIEDALELYDLRSMIAGYLCARAAEAGDKAAIAALRDFVSQMQDAAEAGQEETYFALNLAFHDSIAAASGAVRASEIYGSMGKEVRLMRLRVLAGKPSLLLSNAEHARIVDAIERGDVDSARTEGAQHHANGKKRLLETL